MGWYLRKFSTIFRGSAMLGFKERWNARKIVKKLNHADGIIFKKIPEEVEKDHRVSQAIIDAHTALNDHKIGIHSLDKFLVDIQLSEDNFHDALEAFIRGLDRAPVSKETYQLMIDLLEKMKEDMNREDKGEREEYKDVMAFIIAAKKGHETLRNSILTRFKDVAHESFLERLAVRLETKTITKSIDTLATVSEAITTRRNAQEVVKDLEKASKAVHEGMVELNDAKKRAMLWMSKIFFDLFLVEALGEKYAKMHLVPKKLAEDDKITVEQFTEAILNDMQLIAQGFRIQIKRIEKEIASLQSMEERVFKKK